MEHGDGRLWIEARCGLWELPMKMESRYPKIRSISDDCLRPFTQPSAWIPHESYDLPGFPTFYRVEGDAAPISELLS